METNHLSTHTHVLRTLWFYVSLYPPLFCLFQVAGPIGRAPAKEKRGGAAKGRSGSGFGGKLRADGADIFGKVGKGKCARGNEKKGKWKSKASGGISRPPPSTMGYDNPPPEG